MTGVASKSTLRAFPNGSVGVATQAEEPITEDAKKEKVTKDKREKTKAEKKRKEGGKAAKVKETERKETAANAASTLEQKETEIRRRRATWRGSRR